jgi:hypothetical protein
VDLVALGLALGAAMGHVGPEARVIATTIGRGCPDVACVLDAAVYAENESGWRLYPHPYSSDAKSGASRGPLQVQGAGVRLDDQVARWGALRTWSLAACGDLTGLASGKCGRAKRLVAERRADADSWLYLLPLLTQMTPSDPPHDVPNGPVSYAVAPSD